MGPLSRTIERRCGESRAARQFHKPIDGNVRSPRDYEKRDRRDVEEGDAQGAEGAAAGEAEGAERGAEGAGTACGEASQSLPCCYSFSRGCMLGRLFEELNSLSKSRTCGRYIYRPSEEVADS